MHLALQVYTAGPHCKQQPEHLNNTVMAFLTDQGLTPKLNRKEPDLVEVIVPPTLILCLGTSQSVCNLALSLHIRAICHYHDIMCTKARSVSEISFSLESTIVLLQVDCITPSSQLSDQFSFQHGGFTYAKIAYESSIQSFTAVDLRLLLVV